jgi:hypothetical protein
MGRISHPGNGAAGCWVRSLWSLTLRCVSERCELQVLRFARDGAPVPAQGWLNSLFASRAPWRTRTMSMTPESTR